MERVQFGRYRRSKKGDHESLNHGRILLTNQRVQSGTPCRAERMFQAVERGEMTTDMVKE